MEWELRPDLEMDSRFRKKDRDHEDLEAFSSVLPLSRGRRAWAWPSLNKRGCRTREALPRTGLVASDLADSLASRFSSFPLACFEPDTATQLMLTHIHPHEQGAYRGQGRIAKWQSTPSQAVSLPCP